MELRYENILPAVFVRRPNRFIAEIELAGERVVCHVKNTGRCAELLIPGAEIYVQRASNPARKTQYDLIAVRKGAVLVNMDSQAPNRVAREYLSKVFGEDAVIRSEVTHGDSRFDFCVEHGAKRTFVEVKGVTLEVDGTAMFPDAPTLRGVKHLRGLTRCVEEGWAAMALFVIQMKGTYRLIPNDLTHPEFGAALREAAASGVLVRAVDCRVTPEELLADREIPVEL